jgi:hypothetical protein
VREEGEKRRWRTEGAERRGKIGEGKGERTEREERIRKREGREGSIEEGRAASKSPH